MQERLQELLTREHLTPARFAELVGVQRSSVSHILSGRNKPSLDFLQKIMAKFEHISPDWLISGKGPYKRSEIKSSSEEKNESLKKNYTGLFKFPPSEPSSKRRTDNPVKKAPEISNEEENNKKKHIEEQITRAEISDNKSLTGSIRKRKIVKTILLYDDHTFDVFYMPE